jgi:hypothetical protein
MNIPIELSEINIIPIKPSNGHLGFCTFVIDKKFYVGCVAIFSTIDGGIRLVFPKKNDIPCFYPISKEIGSYITKKVKEKFNELFI